MQQAETLVTPAAYARMRKLNRSTVSRQIRDGVIPTIDGLVDPLQADRARDQNLHPLQRKNFEAAAAPQSGSPEFNRGAEWMAMELCKSARSKWPEFVSTVGMDMVPESMRKANRVLFSALMIHLLQGWAQDFIDPATLPPIDWSCFGKDAATIRDGAETLFAEWAKAA
jgi:hypothetical protein